MAANLNLRADVVRRRRRLGGSGFLAAALVLVPTQCQPAPPPAPAPMPAYVPPATAAATTTTVLASAGPNPNSNSTTSTTSTTSTSTTSTTNTTSTTSTTSTTVPAARTCAGAAATPGTNLLANASFETGSPLADGWIDESTTVQPPIYSISTTAGVVDGTRGQAFTYVGTPDDDGGGKAQFYQGPIVGVTAGQRVRFSICVTAAGTGPASLVRSYGAVGVEAFRSSGAYISDDATYITRLDATPTRYAIDYVVPPGTGYLAVYVQAPEVYATSVFDIVFDQASLVAVP